jgi:hypothetical protein
MAVIRAESSNRSPVALKSVMVSPASDSALQAKDIVSCATFHPVGTGAAVEGVVAAIAVQPVVTGTCR